MLQLKVFKFQRSRDDGVPPAVSLAFVQGPPVTLTRLEANVSPSIHASILSEPIPLEIIRHIARPDDVFVRTDMDCRRAIRLCVSKAWRGDELLHCCIETSHRDV